MKILSELSVVLKISSMLSTLGDPVGSLAMAEVALVVIKAQANSVTYTRYHEEASPSLLPWLTHPDLALTTSMIHG